VGRIPGGPCLEIFGKMMKVFTKDEILRDDARKEAAKKDQRTKIGERKELSKMAFSKQIEPLLKEYRRLLSKENYRRTSREAKLSHDGSTVSSQVLPQDMSAGGGNSSGVRLGESSASSQNESWEHRAAKAFAIVGFDNAAWPSLTFRQNPDCFYILRIFVWKMPTILF
jgi:hypothetical protein